MGSSGFEKRSPVEPPARGRTDQLVCLVHCEDEAKTRRNEERLRADGRRDGGVIPQWRSREAELVAVNQVLMLTRITGACDVVAHASHKAFSILFDLLARMELAPLRKDVLSTCCCTRMKSSSCARSASSPLLVDAERFRLRGEVERASVG
jgi:hypothetical protein